MAFLTRALVFLIFFFLSYYAFRIGDQGLADLLGLTTLRHGTNPKHWISIHIHGADPKMGGAKTGGDENGNGEGNRGRFFMAYDALHSSRGAALLIKEFELRRLAKRHAVNATVNLGKEYGLINEGSSFPAFCLKAIGWMVPNIKFRLPPECVSKFQIDPDPRIGNDACFSSGPISSLNIGFAGTVWNGLSLKTLLRMRTDPMRSLFGMGELAFFAAATFGALRRFSSRMSENKLAIIAGAFFAII